MTFIAEPDDFCDVLFTMKSVVMRTIVRWDIFTDWVAFFADQEVMILIIFLVSAECPLSDGRNMVNEFMVPQKLQNPIDRHMIHSESFGYFVGIKWLPGIIFEVMIDLFSRLCIAHGCRL